jgi:hypothetical protein
MLHCIAIAMLTAPLALLAWWLAFDDDKPSEDQGKTPGRQRMPRG